jgi:hypothetical protein
MNRSGIRTVDPSIACSIVGGLFYMNDLNAMHENEMPNICECCLRKFYANDVADIAEELRLEYTFCGTCIRMGIQHFASQIEEYLFELGKQKRE